MFDKLKQKARAKMLEKMLQSKSMWNAVAGFIVLALYQWGIIPEVDPALEAIVAGAFLSLALVFQKIAQAKSEIAAEKAKEAAEAAAGLPKSG